MQKAVRQARAYTLIPTDRPNERLRQLAHGGKCISHETKQEKSALTKCARCALCIAQSTMYAKVVAWNVDIDFLSRMCRAHLQYTYVLDFCNGFRFCCLVCFVHSFFSCIPISRTKRVN